MAKAIESGMPKMRIEESAARKQARIDQGIDVIVGVNKYKLPDEKIDFDVREVPASVRDEQVARLNGNQGQQRQARPWKRPLADLTSAAESGGNLLEAALPAVRARATVGEISDAMEKVFGRFVATTRCISGAYASEYMPATRRSSSARGTNRGFPGKTGPPAADAGHQDGSGRS